MSNRVSEYGRRKYWFRYMVNDILEPFLYVGDPEYDGMPTWKKMLMALFIISLPLIGSIDKISF